ncbi:hypothetical protein MRX96_011831 [Rhipicephalus microplus]
MTLPVQNKGGTGMAFPNGSWTGLIGELQANRADLALGPMAITYHRIQLAHFTPQVLTEYLTILAGFPDEMEVNAFGTLMVFEWEVWVALFCSLLVCVMASVLADATSWHPTGRTNQMCKLVRQNWWAYTSAMFMEPPMHTPDSSPGRLVLGAWWLTILVLDECLHRTHKGHYDAASRSCAYRQFF